MTVLAIDGIHIAPQSARFINQTFGFIEQAKQARRTVNGRLKDNSAIQFRKYKSTISCSDMNGLSFDKNWPGKTVVVDCVAELSYLTAGGSPGRTVVTGSSRISGDTTFFCPQLTMLVMDYNIQEDNTGKVVAWNLDLEEV